MDDDDLVTAARGGDIEAYGVLFVRHRAVAGRVAVRHGRAVEADDVVAEVFVRVLDQIRAGRGPTQVFRAYLLAAIRHEAMRRSVAAQRCRPLADPEHWAVVDDAPEVDDRLVEAYATLPDRWRSALWQLEVEGRRPRELARELGLTPNAVSALGYRARAALRTAYLEGSTLGGRAAA